MFYCENIGILTCFTAVSTFLVLLYWIGTTVAQVPTGSCTKVLLDLQAKYRAQDNPFVQCASVNTRKMIGIWDKLP